MITAITTCKGRLSHLKRTLPAFAAEFEQVIVVDWDCPDNTAEYCYRLGISNIAPLYIPNGDVFHKTAAMNAGARFAIKGGADRLCFIDADTMIIREGLRAELETLTPDKISITGPKHFAHSQLVGFLCVQKNRFEEINGFNEDYIGWGYEDLDMRMRLICDAGCKPMWIDETMFASIRHHNDERSKFQSDSLQASAIRNRTLFRAGLGERLAEHWSKELKDALPYR